MTEIWAIKFTYYKERVIDETWINNNIIQEKKQIFINI